MADKPEGPEDDPIETEDDGAAAEAEVSALAELALCENLSQTSGWAARWSATMAGDSCTFAVVVLTRISPDLLGTRDDDVAVCVGRASPFSTTCFGAMK